MVYIFGKKEESAINELHGMTNRIRNYIAKANQKLSSEIKTEIAGIKTEIADVRLKSPTTTR